MPNEQDLGREDIVGTIFLLMIINDYFFMGSRKSIRTRKILRKKDQKILESRRTELVCVVFNKIKVLFGVFGGEKDLDFGMGFWDFRVWGYIGSRKDG